jgi:hypothetical protein
MFGEEKIMDPFFPSSFEDDIELLVSGEGIEDPFRFLGIFRQESVELDHLREQLSRRELEFPPAVSERVD